MKEYRWVLPSLCPLKTFYLSDLEAEDLYVSRKFLGLLKTFLNSLNNLQLTKLWTGKVTFTVGVRIFARAWQSVSHCYILQQFTGWWVKQTDRNSFAGNRPRNYLCINKCKASLSWHAANTPLNPQHRQAERQFITLIPSDTFHKQFIHWFVFAMSHSCSYIIKRKYLADGITWQSLSLSVCLFYIPAPPANPPTSTKRTHSWYASA